MTPTKQTETKQNEVRVILEKTLADSLCGKTLERRIKEESKLLDAHKVCRRSAEGQRQK